MHHLLAAWAERIEASEKLSSLQFYRVGEVSIFVVFFAIHARLHGLPGYVPAPRYHPQTHRLPYRGRGGGLQFTGRR